MSTLDGRTDRLYPSLSARERAVLIMQATHADEPVDPRVRWTMPERQYAEFDGYLSQLRAVTTSLSPYVLMLAQEVRFAWLQLHTLAVLCQWAFDRSALLEYIAFQTDEPCTQAEYEQHLAEARADYLSLACAVDAVLVARQSGNDDASAAPQREQAIAVELRELVAAGRLPARRRGARMMLNAGALYDWLGQPTPVYAAWGRGYVVVPDGDVAWRREARERVRDRAARGPGDPMHVLPELALSSAAVRPDAELGPYDALLRGSARQLHAGLVRLSGAYGALEAVIAEVAAGLGGHDPLEPMLREAVTQMGTDLAELREHSEGLVGVVKVPEPDLETLQKLRTLVFEAET